LKSLYYDARSEKHQIILVEVKLYTTWKYKLVNFEFDV